MDIEYLNQWIGKEETRETVISLETAHLMQATLNREPNLKKGDVLPPAWHWMYFHEATRADDLGLEGHPDLGGFMPPVSFGGDEPPRRMWAGGKLSFEQPLKIGDSATKRSTVKSITAKEGRSGKLVFVTIEHEISVGDTRCILEEQNIVYREPVQSSGAGDNTSPAPDDSEFSIEYTPNPIMLFRYSALTFNSHRIHYDVDFARQQEGYPDLVVHGPLTATLLLDLFYHQFPEKRITGFEYRGRSPLFNPNPFTINGKADGQAWASNHEDGLAMSATIEY